MKSIGTLWVALIAALVSARSAGAATLYVSPDGTALSGCTTRANPCSLAGAANAAVAGDTVILADGIYKTALAVKNSGTATAWITFKADDCATPIVEGAGVGPTDDNQDTGIGSSTAEYLRFIGIVSRGWNTGFGNGWAGGTESTALSNGHWEIQNCISYSNGRTGYTFYSAADFHLQNSIAAHNGSSSAHSWSSGVTLFEASGKNLIEGNVSFENTDAERRTDGSGFIVDEGSNNAIFINNIAFGNSGSCLRLTKSSGTNFINNTCYRNAQFGSMAVGPSNPSELYFTNSGVTIQGVTFANNVIVGTGQAPASAQPVVNMPTSGWTNNVVTTGSPTFLTAPTGTNPNFVPAAGDTMLIGKGTTMGAPATDIGLDPRCIVKRTPVMVGQVARVSTWQYDVDIEYIKSIGGVARCFNPAARSGTPDIGAYRAGAVNTATPGSCAGGTTGTGGAGGAGSGGAGMATGGTGPGGRGGGVGLGGRGGEAGARAATGGRGVAGMSGAGTGGATATGGAGGAAPLGGRTGAPGTGGAGGVPAGMGDSGGSVGSGGSAVATGGSSSGGASASGGAAAGTGGRPGSGGAPGGGALNDQGGCGCVVASNSTGVGPLAGLAGIALVVAVLRRRRRCAR